MNAVRRTGKIIIIKHVWLCCPTDLPVVIFVPTYFTILTIYYYYFINHGWLGYLNIPAMLFHYWSYIKGVTTEPGVVNKNEQEHDHE